MSIIKEKAFQQGTSYSLVLAFFAYHLVSHSINYKAIAASYPERASNTNHVVWFVKLVLSAYFWSVLSLCFTLVLLLLLQFLVMFVVKLEPAEFQGISGTQPSGALLDLSKKYVEQAKHNITSSDLFGMVFSFLTNQPQVVFGYVASTVMLAVVFAILVVSPGDMSTVKKKETNTRLFFVTILVFTMCVSILYTMTGNPQPTRRTAK
jgi:hypothetical protein